MRWGRLSWVVLGRGNTGAWGQLYTAGYVWTVLGTLVLGRRCEVLSRS